MSRIIRMLVAIAAAFGLGAAGLMAAGVASAGTYTGQAGWTLIAPQTDSYTAQVLQPINSDGSSVFNHKSSTIPVQFKVTDTQSFAFESIVKGDNTQAVAPASDNAYSSASYTPPAGTTVSGLTSLVADYSWVYGTDHGGSLRWSINVGPNQNVFVYYGDEPNTTSETTGVNGSGTNLLSLSDLRFDTSQVGGSFYDTWAHAQSLVGSDAVNYVALVVDGGWGGDQILKLQDASVTANGVTSTFSMPGSVTTQTNSAPAWISLSHLSGTPGPVDESTLTSTQGDTGGQFRQVDGKYIYNLPVNDLSGAGDYSVGVSFHSDGSSPVPYIVHFGLR